MHRFKLNARRLGCYIIADRGEHRMDFPPAHFEDPAATGRRAQLLLALLLLSLFPVTLLYVPAPTHSVRIDLAPLPEMVRPDLQPQRAYILSIPIIPADEAEPPRSGPRARAHREWRAAAQREEGDAREPSPAARLDRGAGGRMDRFPARAERPLRAFRGGPRRRQARPDRAAAARQPGLPQVGRRSARTALPRTAPPSPEQVPQGPRLFPVPAIFASATGGGLRPNPPDRA